MGYGLGTVLGIDPDIWSKAANGDQAAIGQVQEGMKAWLGRMTEPTQSSVGRDVARGRRSEIAFTNGLVAEKGAEVGVPAPTHAALTEHRHAHRPRGAEARSREHRRHRLRAFAVMIKGLPQ